VQAGLAARMDRLPARAKALVQTMSVIGGAVPEPLLNAVSELGSHELTEAMEVLARSQWVVPGDASGDREYAFKHPLTQEVAYNSQLGERRRRTHAIVAAAITDVVASRGSALGDALAAGLALGGAVERLAEHGRVRLVASAHTSAALSPRAPLTERPEACATEEAVLEALGSDAGELVDLSRSLWADGGACGVAVLAMLGRVFPGRGADIVFYECPVGIGYVVASVARP
jgi:predicted ATPase